MLEYLGYRKKSRKVKIATLVPAKVMLRLTFEFANSRLIGSIVCGSNRPTLKKELIIPLQ